jgi:FG-GAP-like repeat
VTPPINTGGGSLSVNVSGSQFTYVENAAPASPVTITVAGSGVLNGATVQLVNGYSPTEDRLSIVGQTGTSGVFNTLNWNYNSANGTFTITGNGSAADYQTILQSVVYSNTSDNPTSGDRTIRYIVANGSSNVTTSTNFTVTAVDDAPVFTVPNNLAVLAGSPGATVTSFTFADADTPIASYTFSVLNAQGQPDARFVVENGQLKLAPTATLAATDLPVNVIIQATTGGVAFRSTPLTIGPSSTTNAGSFQIGGLGAATGVTYLEGAAPVAIAPALTITGAGAAATLNGGQVSVTGFVPGQDSLSITGAAAGATTGTIAGTTITWTYAPTTGIMTFTGAGTPANYQTAFGQVLYSNSSQNPSVAPRTFQYTVGTGATAGQANLPLTLTAVNNAPTGVTFTPTTGPIGAGGILGTIVIQDPDSTTFTYTFGTPGQANDTRFEIVTLANGTRQLKLKDGITLAAPVNLTIGVNDGGTPAGVFASQAFSINPGGVTITAIPQPDELIFDPATGRLTVWTLNNVNQLVAANVVTGAPTVLPGFRVLKTGDFNNDGTSDVLWASASNQLQIWYLAPNGVFLGANPPKLNGQNLSLPAGFEFVGTADMNRDGNLDIVIQNAATQTVQIWQLDGKGVVIGNPINVAGPVGDIDWRVTGFGDFDGDGDQDILFRNERLNAISVWQMNGTQFVGATGLGVAATATTLAIAGFPALPAIYKFGAVGDFTGDGKADIVWRDNADNTILWEIGLTNGTFTATQTSLPKLNNAANWRVAGATDLNGDGSADLLLSNPTADKQVVWLFKNGGKVAPQDEQFIINQIPGTPGIGAPALVNTTTWQVAGVGEFGKVTPV